MIKSALLGLGLVAAVATTAAAQPCYPYSIPAMLPDMLGTDGLMGGLTLTSPRPTTRGCC